jgi:hypothetical protein
MAPTRSGSVKALASTFERASQVFRCAPIRWYSTRSALFHWITLDHRGTAGPNDDHRSATYVHSPGELSEERCFAL